MTMRKKIICDLLIQKLPDYHLVRPTIVMGPGDTSARWKHVMTFRNRSSVDIPYLENSLNIVDVRDVAEGVVSSLLSSGKRTTNITGELVSWELFWKKISSMLNFKINWVTPTYESKKFSYFNFFKWESVTSLCSKNKIGFEKSIIDATYINN